MCIVCPQNQYSSGTGSSSCLVCPAGEVSLAGSSQCQDDVKPDNKNCDAGTTLSNSLCVPCDSGYFSSINTTLKCMPCPQNQYSGTRSSSCLLCPPGMETLAGSAECKDEAASTVLLATLCTVVPAVVLSVPEGKYKFFGAN